MPGGRRRSCWTGGLRDEPPGTKVLRVAGIALKAIFWSALAAEVGWLVLASTAYDLVFSALGQSKFGLVHLLVLGALALSSGLLVVLERRADKFSTSPSTSGRLRRRLRDGVFRLAVLRLLRLRRLVLLVSAAAVAIIERYASETRLRVA